MLRRFPDTYFGKWIATAAALLAIILAIKDFSNIPPQEDFRITQIAVIVLLFIFIFATIVREIQTSRKEKYANINHCRHMAIHLIRDLTSHLLEMRDLQHSKMDVDVAIVRNKFKHTLVKILDQICEEFSILTGTACRAAIKSVKFKTSGGRQITAHVFALARDTKSAKDNRKWDEERESNDKDPLRENYDFRKIWESRTPNDRTFFSNDLTRERGYFTSSVKIYGELPEQISFGDRLSDFLHLRERFWKLPYKSAIVVPIHQPGNPDLDILKKSHLYTAFLAVDSESRNVFKRWDIQIVAEVADALYHPLKLFNDIAAAAKITTTQESQGA